MTRSGNGPAGTVDLALFGDVFAQDGTLHRDAWLSVDEGRIVGIGTAAPEARSSERLAGHLILPGAIDAHVHTRSSLREGIEATTRAAAAGGVTTVLDMPFDAPSDPVGTPERFEAKVDAIGREACVDVALYATFPPTGPLEHLEPLARLGAAGFKVSVYGSDPIRFPRIPDGRLLAAFERIADLGVPVAAHQENQEIVDALIADATAAGRHEPRMHARTRPPVAETEATGRLLEIALATGARLHVVHGTVPRTFDLVERHRADGGTVTAETCVQYLLLDEGELDRLGGRAKCNPPLRAREHVDALWAYLQDGRIDLVASDHSPYPLEDKDVDDIFAARPGLPGVETLPILLYSEGVARGKIDLTRFVRLLASGPAETFGFARKGAIAPGYDADLMVIDPNARGSIDERRLAMSVGWSPYHGREVTGSVVRTFVRGALAFDGERGTVDAGHGRFVAPERTAA